MQGLDLLQSIVSVMINLPPLTTYLLDGGRALWYSASTADCCMMICPLLQMMKNLIRGVGPGIFYVLLLLPPSPNMTVSRMRRWWWCSDAIWCIPVPSNNCENRILQQHQHCCPYNEIFSIGTEFHSLHWRFKIFDFGTLNRQEILECTCCPHMIDTWDMTQI